MGGLGSMHCTRGFGLYPAETFPYGPRTIHRFALRPPCTRSRCLIAPSYAKKMVEVMRELQWRRSASNVFAGRHGFITPRDLFRWAGRQANGYEQLAIDGFAVLGERLRSQEERDLVELVLRQQLNAKVRRGNAEAAGGGSVGIWQLIGAGIWDAHVHGVC